VRRIFTIYWYVQIYRKNLKNMSLIKFSIKALTKNTFLCTKEVIYKLNRWVCYLQWNEIHECVMWYILIFIVIMRIVWHMWVLNVVCVLKLMNKAYDEIKILKECINVQKHHRSLMMECFFLHLTNSICKLTISLDCALCGCDVWVYMWVKLEKNNNQRK
jgi:hypothetical protein